MLLGKSMSFWDDVRKPIDSLQMGEQWKISWCSQAPLPKYVWKVAQWMGLNLLKQCLDVKLNDQKTGHFYCWIPSMLGITIPKLCKFLLFNIFIMQIHNNIDPIDQSLGGVLHHRLVTNWFFPGEFVHRPEGTYGNSWDYFSVYIFPSLESN